MTRKTQGNPVLKYNQNSIVVLVPIGQDTDPPKIGIITYLNEDGSGQCTVPSRSFKRENVLDVLVEDASKFKELYYAKSDLFEKHDEVLNELEQLNDGTPCLEKLKFELTLLIGHYKARINYLTDQMRQSIPKEIWEAFPDFIRTTIK